MTDTHDVVAAQAPDAPAPADLSGLKVAELQAVAARLGVPGAGRMRKAELLAAVLDRTATQSRPGTTAPATRTNGTTRTKGTTRANGTATGAAGAATGTTGAVTRPRKVSTATAPTRTVPDPTAPDATVPDVTAPAVTAREVTAQDVTPPSDPAPAATAPEGTVAATRPARTRRRVATSPAGAPAGSTAPTDEPTAAEATVQATTGSPVEATPGSPVEATPGSPVEARVQDRVEVRVPPEVVLPSADAPDGPGRTPSRARRRAQRDAATAVEEAVLKAEPILPDMPLRSDRQQSDRQQPDRQQSNRQRPVRDHQQSDRQQSDRQQSDRQQSDRLANDRPAEDRGPAERSHPDADRGFDRELTDRQAPDRFGLDGVRDDLDDEPGGRRRRGRNRQRDKVRSLGVREPRGMDEPEVREDDVLVPVAGIVDILESYAFVRTSGYLAGPADVYVSLAQVKKYGLRKGDAVVGQVKQERPGGDERRGKFNPIVQVDSVNGQSVDEARTRDDFTKLTPLYPQKRLRLETTSTVLSTRIIDLVAPIGKGQRGLIVSPPKAGKTLVLQAIANAITTNNPECHLMVVLVDERPEEVTDMQRTVKGEVIASTFDRPAEDHTTVAELAIERAKRLVELGHDVVVLLDSITRLGRAYNLAAPASGRILSGGVDASALYPPKRFFGAARNIENGGSLTILATALVETGSKMDEVIFEEFKGTGNMELRLSRQLADKRIYPAVDVNPSGTRREEVLLDPDELRVMWQLRRVLSGLDPQQAIELLLDRLKKSPTNTEFLLGVGKTAPAGNRDDG